MNKVKIILLFILLGQASSNIAHEIVDDRIDIDHLLATYSELNGTKFVTDPRVRGRVKVIGLKLEEITQTNLIDILVIHNFIATEKDDVVYVLPRMALDYMGDEIGPLWGSQ